MVKVAKAPAVQAQGKSQQTGSRQLQSTKPIQSIQGQISGTPLSMIISQTPNAPQSMFELWDTSSPKNLMNSSSSSSSSNRSCISSSSSSSICSSSNNNDNNDSNDNSNIASNGSDSNNKQYAI
eukprot:Awhi_evm1s15087